MIPQCDYTEYLLSDIMALVAALSEISQKALLEGNKSQMRSRLTFVYASGIVSALCGGSSTGRRLK